MALVRTDPFRDIDRVFHQLWGVPSRSALASTLSAPIDAERKGEQFLVRMDLPGVRADDIEITVEENVLTVKAERSAPEASGEVETLVAERLFGTFSRQLYLGPNLDTTRIDARLADGVLSLVIPIAEHAKPRRIAVGTAKGGAPIDVSGAQPVRVGDGA